MQVLKKTFPQGSPNSTNCIWNAWNVWVLCFLKRVKMSRVFYFLKLKKKSRTSVIWSSKPRVSPWAGCRSLAGKEVLVSFNSQPINPAATPFGRRELKAEHEPSEIKLTFSFSFFSLQGHLCQALPPREGAACACCTPPLSPAPDIS